MLWRPVVLLPSARRSHCPPTSPDPTIFYLLGRDCPYPKSVRIEKRCFAARIGRALEGLGEERSRYSRELGVVFWERHVLVRLIVATASAAAFFRRCGCYSTEVEKLCTLFQTGRAVSVPGGPQPLGPTTTAEAQRVVLSVAATITHVSICCLQVYDTTRSIIYTARDRVASFFVLFWHRSSISRRCYCTV